MSRRAYTHCRHAITSLATSNPSIRRPSRACFSRCPKRHQSSPTAQPHEPPRPNNRSTQSHDGPLPRVRRLHLPAILPFLLALPLGWYLSTYPPSFLSSAAPSSSPFSPFIPSDPSTFTSYTLTSREIISPSLAIFHLRPSARTALDLDRPDFARALASVQIKQPQLQIARAYTVLPHVHGQPFHELRLLIRKEEKGEVSGYLHGLDIGDEVEVRGPKKEFDVPEGLGGVVFIAGGTGIAPVLQVGDVVFGEEGGEGVDVRVMWASRGRGDCNGGKSDTMEERGWGWGWSGWWAGRREETKIKDGEGIRKGEMVRRLDQLKEEAAGLGQRQNRLQVDYFVDEENTLIQPADVQRALRQPSDGNGVTRRLLFVSGPEGFVNYWAGPKQWINGREMQGPLGGVLAKLDTTGWEVVKL